MTPADWIAASADGIIHVRGEEIRPSFCRPGSNCNQLGLAILDPARYVVQAVAPGAAGELYSDPSVVVETWTRGDTDDNEVSDFDDIARVKHAFLEDFGTGTPPLTHQMADLTGAGAVPDVCEPQGPGVGIDFKDIAEAVAAFVEDPDPCDDLQVYSGTAPPGQTVPTGATVTLRPGNKYYFTGRRLDVDLRDTDGSVTGTVGTPLVVPASLRASRSSRSRVRSESASGLHSVRIPFLTP